MRPIAYVHVDVFTDRKLSGNGLAVVFCDGFFEPAVMLDLAREFKQFETIFLTEFDGEHVRARIFTMEGELPFAGHPVLGAAAALHDRYGQGRASMPFSFLLADKEVAVVSARTKAGFHAQMRQGPPRFLGQVRAEDIPWFAGAHGLSPEDLDPALPMEVVSTGLPYLLIPVRNCLHRARITARDLASRIAAYGASYTYLFDHAQLEARTWDNLGLVEDSATGSAAGPVCAYLVRHGMLGENETVVLRQGRFANRPGVLRARMESGEVYVSGDVVFFARGTFTLD